MAHSGVLHCMNSRLASSAADAFHTFGFRRGEDPIIAGIEEKIAEWTHLPPDYGEPIQILRYVDGQEYDAHVSDDAPTRIQQLPRSRSQLPTYLNIHVSMQPFYLVMNGCSCPRIFLQWDGLGRCATVLMYLAGEGDGFNLISGYLMHCHAYRVSLCHTWPTTGTPPLTVSPHSEPGLRRGGGGRRDGDASGPSHRRGIPAS